MRKLTCFLIAAAMACTALPTLAFAEDDAAADEAAVEAVEVIEDDAADESIGEIEDEAADVDEAAEAVDETVVNDESEEAEEEPQVELMEEAAVAALAEEAETEYVAKLGYTFEDDMKESYPDVAVDYYTGYESIEALATAITNISYSEVDGIPTLTLDDDVELDALQGLEIVSGTVTIDLNGHTLSRNIGTSGTSSTYRYRDDKYLVVIDEGATLNVKDSSESGGGKMYNAKYYYYTIPTSDKSEYKGQRVDQTSKYSSIYGICNYGTLNIASGTIETEAGNAIYSSGDSVTATGGTITSGVYGIYVESGSLSMNNVEVNAQGPVYLKYAPSTGIGFSSATITGCTLNGTSHNGIYTGNGTGGTLTVTDSTIKCTGSSAAIVSNATSTTISNCTVEGAYNSAITVNSSTCEISKCTITNTNSSSTVSIAGATATISDCSITNNLATGSSTATHTSALQVSGGATVTVSGDTTIECDSKYGVCVSTGESTVNIKSATVTGGTAGVYVNSASGSAEISGGTVTGAVTAAKGTITITGGTFDSDVTAYTTDDYYAKKVTDDEGNVTYVITSASAVINDTATESNYSVELVTLKGNDSVENEKDYTYTVTAETVEASDYVTTTDDYTGNFAVDISVEVTNTSTGEAITGVEITNQEVTITLPVAMNVSKITHIKDNTTTEDISITSQDSAYKTVTFTAPSFSAYIVQGTIQNSNVTDNVTLSLAETGTAGVYDVVLTAADDSSYINRFTAAQLSFYAETVSGTDCSIVVSQLYDYIDVTDEGSGVYLINVDSETAGSVSGETITIARLTLVGVGTYSIYLDTTYDNMVQTTTAENNLYLTHTPDATNPSDGTLIYTAPLVSNVIVSLASTTLTINVVFPNDVSNNIADYESMKVGINHLVYYDDETISLGSDTGTTSSGAVVSYSTDAIDGVGTYNCYTITTTVVKNYETELTFTGEGYRTFRTSIVPTGDTATVTVWNNAMDESQTVISADDADSAVSKTVTFLAGEIVADNEINLYDLSAVVSYFGKTGMSTAGSTYTTDYVKYDLNRDGKIDSKDIAMVLVSWGE